MSYLIRLDGVPVRAVPELVPVAEHKGYTIEPYEPPAPAPPPPPPPPPTLDERRATVVATINAERDRLMALGAAHGGKLFALDDVSRTDLGGMATTAALVIVGALSWPAEYQIGWISLDNSRLPLPNAPAGVALAAAVAQQYAALVQHARDLKDAALASSDPEAIDITAGWPGDEQEG